MDYLSDLILFTIDFSGTDDIEYNENTDIEKDVGITGDDAADYLVEFGKRYNVDLSNFNFDDHFDPEGYAPPGSIMSTFLLFECKNNNDKKPLTIGDLLNAIAKGKLL